MNKSFNYKRFIALAIICALFSGCSLLEEYKITKETPNTFDMNYTNQASEVREFGKQNFEWGLALSGGGIRSSAYSIGVMKALHEKKILQKIEVISAVSGGGYAAYWLLSTESNSSKPFGDLAFENENFIINTCKLMTLSNFMSYGKMTTLVGKNNEEKGKIYSCAIERTYGYNDITIDKDSSCSSKNESKAKMISNYLADVTENRIPYFIYNTTLTQPEAKKGWQDGLYEITPLFRGNNEYEYVEWDNDSLPLSMAATISGAALKKQLEQKIKHKHQGIDDCKIKLSDGGHSDNLGAIALIRRGVKNIIISDAEKDSDLSFQGYYILKDRLKAAGLTLEILDENINLDSRKIKPPINISKWWETEGKRKAEDWWEREEGKLAQGYFKAIVYKSDDQSKKPISTIYYIKASIVGEVKAYGENIYTKGRDRRDKQKESLEEMYNAQQKNANSTDHLKTENATVCSILTGNNTGTCNDSNKDFVCSELENREINGTKWIEQNAIIRSQNNSWWQFGTDFPHYSTKDQSYYVDQFTSYMGLGYIQALKADLNVTSIENNTK